MSGKSRITIANISANAKSQGKQHVQHDYVRENIEKFEENSKKQMKIWLTKFKTSSSLGQFWRGSLGGGYITGIAENNEISGDNLAYIFPNLTGMFSMDNDIRFSNSSQFKSYKLCKLST